MFSFNPILEEQARYLKQNLSKSDRILETLIKENFPDLSFEIKSPVDDYIVDFLFPEKKLAIEIDSGQQENTDAYVYHAERKERLESLGLTVYRIEEKVILNSDAELLRSVKKMLD